MAASFVREVAAGNGSSPAPAVGGAGVPVNDLLVIFVEKDVAVVTDSKGNTWTKRESTTLNTEHAEVWWCSVTVALTAQDTISIATGTTVGYQVWQFTGSGAAWTVRQSYSDQTFGSTFALGPTVLAGNVVVNADYGGTGAFTQTSSPSWTMVDTDFAVTGGFEFDGAYMIPGSNGTYTFQGTNGGGSVNYSRMFIEFAPSGATTFTKTVSASQAQAATLPRQTAKVLVS